MPRAILEESRIHPAIREKIATHNHEIVDEVAAAVAAHPVVVVGMAINPVPRKVRALLESEKIAFHYLEYGSYLSDWRRRTALKMWTGWPTFPMVFVRGVFVGGFSDVEALVKSGEMAKLVAG